MRQQIGFLNFWGDNTKEGDSLQRRGDANHPRMKLWYRVPNK